MPTFLEETTTNGRGLFITERPIPNLAPSAATKAVVVHGGARDGYQLALGLSEAGMLEALVTDAFWSEENGFSSTLSEYLPKRLLAMLRKRSAPGLPAHSVQSCARAALGGFMLDKLRWTPFAMRRDFVRSCDRVLGRVAGRRARMAGVGLVSYSYFGYDAFREYGRGGMLFQVHPHPCTMRRILQGELERHPDCAASLQQEWELSLSPTEFNQLVEETKLAGGYLAASSFVRNSLIENGADPASISVVPYGVDLQRFRPDTGKHSSRTSKLRLLFVGRINQRKGVKYLLDALRLLRTDEVELVVCGRVLDDLSIFKPFSKQVSIRSSVSNADLVRAYQSADLFVFPSIGEGFGHVLLEALACGLPVLSTTHTAAPDLIEEGVQGFVVEPCNPEQLAERIDWALRNRTQLAFMDEQARLQATRFSWDRFRASSARAVREFLGAQRSHQTARRASHV